MRFPVDLLADVSQAELERSAHNYMNDLLHSNPDFPEHLTLSDYTQVTIDISSVGFTPLYGSSDKQRVLALFSPSDPFTAVALYLLDQWWAVDDILRTADAARDGAVEVETVGERIVLYILNRVIYRVKEMSSEELPFLCHGEKDYAKILWNSGEAVGFYSVKPSGSLCNSFSTRSYQLPVMDSIFVRKCQRGKGFGLQMLEDFVLSFKEDYLGLRYPLTKSMYKVCQKYLCQYPGDTDLLWEVESIGGPNQRTNIASKIRAIDLSAVSKSLSLTEESLVITEVTEKDVESEAVTTQMKADSMECTVEIVEEVTVLRTTKVLEAEEVPVAGRGRSSGSKRRNAAEKITEDKPEKVIRIEDIEAETPREQQVSAQGKTTLHNISELEHTEGMFCVATEDLADTTAEEEASMMLHIPASVLASQETEEAEAMAASMTEEPQVEEDITQHLKNTSHDSQIMVENVASEIEEAEERCEKEDSVMSVVFEEALEVHKEAETHDEVAARTEIEVSDEKSEEKVIQHKLSLSTHTTSEVGEAGKTVEENEIPRRRSQRHGKPQGGLIEETAVQDGGRVLRGRTVMGMPTPKRKYTRHSQKICEECEEQEEIKEDVVTVEILPEEKQQHEDEQLTNEEEPVEEDSKVKKSPTELLDTAESALTEENKVENMTNESEKEDEEVETSVVQDKQEVSEDETEDAIPKAEKAAEDVRPPTKVNVEESRDVQEEETEQETETVSAMEADKEEEAIGVPSVSDDTNVAPASETVIPDEVRDEAVIPIAEEPQNKDIGSEIPKLQKATVILVDLKTTCQHLSLNEAEGETVVGECATPDKEQLEIIAPEEKDVSSYVALEQTSEPEMLMLEEDNGGKQENIAEEAVDATAEAQTVKKEELEEDNSEKEKSASVDEQTSEAEETPVIETRVLRSGRKTIEVSFESRGRSKQQQEEDEEAEEIDNAETGTVEVEGAMEAVAQNAVTVPVPMEEEESAVSESHADTEADILVGDDIEENLPQAELDEAMNLEEEAAVVETRERSETIEELAVTTRTMRQGRISASATPKDKTRRTQTQIREEEECKIVAQTGVEEEEADVEAAVESTNEEKEEKIEEIGEKEDAVSEREESLEPEIEVQEGNAVAEEGQNVVEEHSEVISKTFAEREGNSSSDKCDEKMPVMGIDEVELPPVAVTRSLRSGGKMSKAPPKTRPRRSKKQEDEEKEEGGASVRKSTDGGEPPVETGILRKGGKSVGRSCKQVKKKTEELKESSEEVEVEEEAGLGSAEESPTEEDRTEVEKEELVTVEVEKGEEGKLIVTDEEEIQAAAEGETHTPLAKPNTDSAILTPSEEDTTPSAQEQQSGEMASQLSDLQRVTVILVDLKKAHHEVQGETAAAEADEDQTAETMTEEPVAEEHVPGSPAEIERTELERVVAEEESLEENVEDIVTVWEHTGEGSVEETEAKNDDDEVPKVTETRKQRSRKQAAKATPRRKSARSRQKTGEEEKEAYSEISEGEPEVQVRVLRRGRKSIPVAQRCTTTITQQQLQKAEIDGEESTGVEEREAEEEEQQHQVIDQERAERLEEKDATQQAENIAQEMNVEEAITQQDAPEEEQAGSTETAADENTEAPVGQSADERRKSDDVAKEAVTQQDTAEGEQSVSTTETPLTAKDGKAKGVSEEEDTSVIGTGVLRSGEAAVRAEPESKTAKTPDGEQDVEAAREKSTEDDPEIETRVLRGRRSAPAISGHKSKRARIQCQTEDEPEGEETEADEKENNSAEKMEEKVGEEAEAQKEENTEPGVEMETVETVDEQSTAEEEQSAVSQTCADGQGEASVRGSTQNTSATNKGKVNKDEEAPVVKSRILKSGEKAVKDTPRSKTTKSQQEENEKVGKKVVEKSAATDEPAETRVLRRGRSSAPDTSRHKSKRARTQCHPQDETEGEEEEAGQESPEEKEEQAEKEEGKCSETKVGKNKDLDLVESVAGGESVVGDAEQMKAASTEETAVPEKDDNSGAAVVETSTDTVQISSAEVEGTNPAEEEETAAKEKCTAATEVGSDTVSAEEEAVVEDAVAQEEAPAVTRALRSKTKTSHATPSRRTKRQIDQGVLEAQQQKEENPELGEKQEEVRPLTVDSAEIRELIAKEPAEIEESAPTGQEAGPPAEDTAEDHMIDNRVQEPAAEEMESAEHVSCGESEEDKTLNPSAVEGRNLRRRMKNANKEEDNTEEIQLLKRRSIRKRPRVDYRENDEEDEGGEIEAATDKEEEDEDNKKAECSVDEQIEKLGEKLEKDMGAIESTSEKGETLNLVLDTDEEVETAAINQEHDEDEQNISEEEVEPTVIGKRVLRGRSVPSVIITPRSKPKHRNAQKAEESLSDEEKSSQSAQKRRLRKRKSTEVTPPHRSKRHSRV